MSIAAISATATASTSSAN